MTAALETAMLALALGLTIGLFAGALRGGAGALTTPVLFYGFVLLNSGDAGAAVGTALAVTALASVWAAAARRRSGDLDMERLRAEAPIWAASGITGGAAAAFAPEAVLTSLIGFAAFGAGLGFAFGGLLPAPRPAGKATFARRALVGFGASITAAGGHSAASLCLPPAGHGARLGYGAGVGVLTAAPAAVTMIVIGLGRGDINGFSVGGVNLAIALIAAPMIFAAAPHGVTLGTLAPRAALRASVGLVLIVAGLSLIRGAFGDG